MRRDQADPQTTRVAIYETVRDQSQEAREASNQRLSDLDAFVRCARGLTLHRCFIDGSQGPNPLRERPAASRLLADAARGKFKLLLVASPERLSREPSDLIGFLKALSALGVTCYVLADRESGAIGPSDFGGCRWEAVPLGLDVGEPSGLTSLPQELL